MIEWDGNKSKCGRFEVRVFGDWVGLCDTEDPRPGYLEFKTIDEAKQAAEGIANPVDTGLWFKLMGCIVFVVLVWLVSLLFS